MVRRSLVVAVLLAVASPLAAQEEMEYVWSSDRPDADAPLGVLGARTLDGGALELQYKFTQLNSRGVWFVNDSLPLATTLQLYGRAPLTLSQQTHSVIASFGVTDDLTVIGTAEFSIYEREQLNSNGVFFITGAEELGDVQAHAVYNVYRQGPFRGNLSLGVVIPTGASTTYAVTPVSGGAPEPQPYDMRPGGGAIAIMPGATAQVQNEFGSLGAQFRARINLDVLDQDWVPGDRYEAHGWAAYRFNDVLSVSAGIQWQMWANIEGADPRLDPTRDPGSDPVFLAGQRADLPIGINLLMPSGPLAGHLIQVKSIYALHHDYEGPQLGLDWGLNFGWKVPF